MLPRLLLCRLQQACAYPVLATWVIHSKKSERRGIQSRSDKHLFSVSPDGYLGNEAERGYLLFAREGKYQMEIPMALQRIEQGGQEGNQAFGTLAIVCVPCLHERVQNAIGADAE